MGKVLDGRVAVITGGGTGIGAAIARRFAAEGCHVVVAGRRPAPIEAVARETGGLAVAADVAREADVSRLFAACREAHGRLDVLVNNAGIRGPVMPIEAMDTAGWDEIMAVNVVGVLLCIKHAVALMAKGSSIVNVSSISGFKGKALRAAYCSSKFAVGGITECVAQELGPMGIRVNDVCPGGVTGERFMGTARHRAAALGISVEDLIRTQYTDTAALGRLIEADEVADAALFLTSAAAGAVTGQHLAVDCGRMS